MSPKPVFMTVVIQMPEDPALRARLMATLNFGVEGGCLGGTCTGMAQGDLLTEMEQIEAAR